MAIRLYDLDDTAIRLWIEIKVDKDCDDDDEQIFDEDETQEEAHSSPLTDCQADAIEVEEEYGKIEGNPHHHQKFWSRWYDDVDDDDLFKGEETPSEDEDDSEWGDYTSLRRCWWCW